MIARRRGRCNRDVNSKAGDEGGGRDLAREVIARRNEYEQEEERVENSTSGLSRVGVLLLKLLMHS